ncbi:MAG TPA: transporter substrate-binding domain-containing protein [Beijerinckiaceae bacterium]|nr:transporter substrate-binding domain-containing protein [Beijerinckiaceae bacterium]
MHPNRGREGCPLPIHASLASETDGSTFFQGRGAGSAPRRARRFLCVASRNLARLTLAIALAGFAPAQHALGDPAKAAQEEKPLVLLTEAAHPPYAYLSEKGEMVGFEIDLMNAICARIKRSCLFKHREFDRLVPSLLAGKGDAIVSSLDITDERREKFTLSEPYFRMPALFVARKDEVPKALTPEALANVSIGALRDSPFASLVENRFPDSPLSTYATQIEANLDLAADRVDLVIGDEMSLRDWLKTAPEASCCTAAGRVDDPERIAGEGFAIVVRKGDDGLKQKFDAALKELRGDGSYATIARRYFDFDPL